MYQFYEINNHTCKCKEADIFFSVLGAEEWWGRIKCYRTCDRQDMSPHSSF